MDENMILKKLEEHSEKLDQIYHSAEKVRSYFLWTLIVSILVVVLPAIGLLAAFLPEMSASTQESPQDKAPDAAG